jgi:GNAT superfamily N-acetyltransferase
MLDVRPAGASDLADLQKLFCNDAAARSCWCMWFIISVKEYHQVGAAANEMKFTEMAANSSHPVGVLAYLDGDPVGWLAAGPRSRYVRAVRTPTMKSIDQSENDDVWLAPCFLVRADMRGKGLTRKLLEGAIELARKANATAIEGFPKTGTKRTSADAQVGTEHLFASLGFRPISRPSSNRVLMRLDLSPH